MPIQCFLILGNGRSGTSALTRVISLAGADLPSDLVPPMEANVTGHWEPRAIVAIHLRLRRQLGLTPNDYQPLPEGWLQHPATLRAREEILHHLRADFASSPAFVIKDPQICPFIPLWLDLLDEFGATPRIIFCFRHPLEVAASFQRRGGRPWSVTLPRWLSANIEVEIQTRSLPRAFVSYDDLMTDWKAVLHRIESDLDFTWPRRPQDIEAEVSSFLSPEYRHHQDLDFQTIGNAVLRDHLERTYAALLEARSGAQASLVDATAKGRSYLSELHADPAEEALRYERREHARALQRLDSFREKSDRLKRRVRALRSQKKRLKSRHRRLRLTFAIGLVILALVTAGALLAPR
jgi:hypothetical protein